MRMDERARLTKKDSKPLNVWASLKIRTGGEMVDGVVEPRDAITFTIHSTKRNREFLADRSTLYAYATRSMPGRGLNVTSVRPTPDRKYLMIECVG